MAVTIVTNANFEEEVLKSTVPVLIDFWAAWCGPCRMVSPVVDEIAEEVNNAKICKVNVDEEGDLSIKYGIMSIPTLMVFKNGEVVNKAVGVKSKAEILAMLNV
jgi:thioredoxin 1